MKWLVTPLLGAIFVVLLVGSVQSISAELPEPFAFNAELKDSKYQVYVQIVHRNEDGQLISVMESSLSASTITGAYLPHKITDDIFDTLMGEKEIVTIDNMKYEKVQYIFSPTHKERLYTIFPIFSENPLPPIDHAVAHEKMHEKNLEVSSWRNNYCTTFKEHGYDCVPIFQVLTPSLTLEPHNILNQQWTILRELN